ncbi:MAG: tyrosine-protein phosphatase [Planctomycetes bacterium]|nr:tyrosine-protein phosphatase [Planctomycetota bacterium]
MRLAWALCLLAGCGDADAQKKVNGTTTHRAIAQRIPDVPGLENFARMNPNLYRGAQPTEEGFRQLKAMGVKTVIDFRSFHSTKKQVEAAGLTPVEIPLRADLGSVPPNDEELKRFFEVVLDPARQPVYIHCAFGKDRTGTMAAVYRLEIDGWTADEALQEMEAFGYHNIYQDLIRFIRTYKPRGFGKK